MSTETTSTETDWKAECEKYEDLDDLGYGYEFSNGRKFKRYEDDGPYGD